MAEIFEGRRLVRRARHVRLLLDHARRCAPLRVEVARKGDGSGRVTVRYEGGARGVHVFQAFATACRWVAARRAWRPVLLRETAAKVTFGCYGGEAAQGRLRAPGPQPAAPQTGANHRQTRADCPEGELMDIAKLPRTGQDLYELRLALEMDQYAFAALVGFPRRTWQRKEAAAKIPLWVARAVRDAVREEAERRARVKRLADAMLPTHALWQGR